MLGGSELTMDLTYGRQETVERCGEQPQGPRRKCARLERSQGEKREEWEKREIERRESNTLHIVLHLQPTATAPATTTTAATTTAVAAAGTAATVAATRLQ